MTPTTCPFCGVGCGMVLGVEDGRVTDVRPDRAHPVSRGQLCAKGWNATQFLRSPERLTTPLLRRRGALEPVSWDVALDAAAAALGAARAEGGADAVGVIASARATNEDDFAAMKFARAVLGTNNVDHCARVCHAPSVAGPAPHARLGRDDELDRRHRPRRLSPRGRLRHDREPRHHRRAHPRGAGARRAARSSIDPRRTRLARASPTSTCSSGSAPTSRS